MSRIVTRLPHTCGTKRGLVVYAEDNGDLSSYCFACNTFVPHPLGDGNIRVEDLPKKKEKTPEEIAQELNEIVNYPTVDIKERKLRASSLEAFGVKIALSERDGVTPIEMNFPLTRDGELVGYQVKSLGEYKRVWAVGDCKDVDLFNWENAKRSGARKLIITEGMADSVAVHSIFSLYGKPEYMPAIVSIPYGAGRAHICLQKHVKEIKRLFKDVVLCFDNDGPGQEAVQKCMLVLPEAKSVVLPEKDANDCIMKGRAKAAYNALSFQAEKPVNTRILSGMEVHEKAKQPAKYGELSWPFEKMNKDLRGIRLGETIYITAGVKCGKSTLKSALVAHFIINDKAKVFVAAPEEPNEQTYKLVAGQIAGKIFHDPEVEFDYKAFDNAGEHLKDSLFLLNLYQQLSWETLKQDIINAVGAGCSVVVVDPITSLSNGMDPAEANTLLQSFAQELAAMAKDLNFVAILFAHLKAPEGQLSEDKRASFYGKGQYLDLGNCSHEQGGSVYSNQIAGSRAMMRSAHLLIALLANKDPDLPEQIRNTRQLQVLEDRNLGVSEKYSVFYNKNTGRFVEV